MSYFGLVLVMMVVAAPIAILLAVQATLYTRDNVTSVALYVMAVVIVLLPFVVAKI